MNREKAVRELIGILLEYMPESRKAASEFPEDDYEAQRFLLRALMNIWPADRTVPARFYPLQDKLLRDEAEERGVTHVDDLFSTPADDRIVLCQDDITCIDADAIVNAANSSLTGCFHPGHNCVDNVIHSSAGLQLREECARIIAEQGYEEPVGQAKITRAYNLPAKHIIHTVGPMVKSGNPQPYDRAMLASCYASCLDLAAENDLASVAFCCISTGVYGFPKDKAALIAVAAVRQWLDTHQDERGEPTTSVRRVIFVAYEDEDLDEYSKLLRDNGDE